jgi:hypothetical protein
MTKGQAEFSQCCESKTVNLPRDAPISTVRRVLEVAALAPQGP